MSLLLAIVQALSFLALFPFAGYWFTRGAVWALQESGLRLRITVKDEEGA